ncbi:single-stranded DNA-binding protein [Sneathia sanguinegens]|uniref:single-stranded DNA-binding protein n=1 Tax=Sneathia sanguinegens TaxID=40543 RepID=UPI0023F9C61C|nr:single-stranded DNA-binding protein [Sneathia sanguinegens]MDU4652146.1 single-stranded DNA-binding protein [Sneathia sanguinegens]
MNKVELLGRVTQNIELNYKNDKAYSKFFIAINSNKKDTIFIPCIAYGKLAENISKYVEKGNRIFVSGALNITNKNKKMYCNVILNKIEFIDYKKNNNDINDEAFPF